MAPFIFVMEILAIRIMNHEGYAIQQAIFMVRDAMGLDSYETNESDSATLLADICVTRKEEATPEELAQELDDYDTAELMAKLHNVDRDLLAVALGRKNMDPRKYATQHWKWHALRGDQVETWEITNESLKIIARGILNALDENGDDPDNQDPNEEFWINSYKGNRAIKLTSAQLESGDFGEEFKTPPIAPPDQVRKMDQDMLPGFYKGKMGDSARRVVNNILEGDLRYGWAKGDHVVEVPFVYDEDSNHISNTNLLPDGNDDGWKRWRYNEELGTVFWWETPTLEERAAVTDETGVGPEDQVYVRLHSNRSSDMNASKKLGMRTFSVDDFPEDRYGSNALMNATHVPDADLEPIHRTLNRVGD